MPQWLAYLTPWIDDAPSDEAWEELVARYAELASRWHVLEAEDWRRLDYAVRAVCLREAMLHTQDEKTLGVCRRVLDLCDREAQGEPIDTKTWSAARRAAPEAAAWVAWAVGAAAEVPGTAVAAAKAAAIKAAAEAQAGPVATTEEMAARRIAADRLIAAILDTIEETVSQKT